MPDHAPYRDDDIVNPETHHEESDVNVRALLWSVVIFIVFAGVTHLVLYAQFHAYADGKSDTETYSNAQVSSYAGASPDATPLRA